MARKPRIHFSNAVYHVILRGLDGKAVFKSVADRREWESLVEEGCQRFGHQIHAYCWMKNHVQLAVQVADAPLSRIMQNLSFRYTRYFNKQHAQEGPLFHGRYKAILIEPDQYLNELVRFIHNNPVRNATSKSAADHKWSSYPVYLGKEARWWVTTDTVLRTFGKTDRSAIPLFKKYTDAGKQEGDRPDLMRGTDGGRLLGNAKFAKKALKPPKPVVKPATLNQLVKAVCKELGIKEAALKNESRARYESQIRQTITYLAMELDVASLTALARRFNRDLTTMSRNQRYFRDRLVDDKDLQKNIRRLRRLVLRTA
jgi:REP element-mobilizing transposase RayT